MTEEDHEKRLLMEIWNYNRLTADEFMGSLSFGVGELKTIAQHKGNSEISELLDGW